MSTVRPVAIAPEDPSLALLSMVGCFSAAPTGEKETRTLGAYGAGIQDALCSLLLVTKANEAWKG